MYNISQIETAMFDLSVVGDSRCTSQTIKNRLVSEFRVAGDEPDVTLPRTVATGKGHADLLAQELSERWFIDIAQAHETIKVTTQNYTRSAILSRRYQSNRVYEKPLLLAGTSTSTPWMVDGNRYAQIMANKEFFAVAYPTSKSLKPVNH
jgi:hypothetical protein